MLDQDVVDHQHGASDQEQLLAQRAFFAAPFPEAPEDLYSCRAEGVMERARERVVLKPHAQLSTGSTAARC
jgi:galactofuranosylgalactofuranosylrhamnosyl-N-acetylglucosaminyl-diphospho-decaprenol beta-1,5/1,6-galactofuranosyltransferase